MAAQPRCSRGLPDRCMNNHGYQAIWCQAGSVSKAGLRRVAVLGLGFWHLSRLRCEVTWRAASP